MSCLREGKISLKWPNLSGAWVSSLSVFYIVLMLPCCNKRNKLHKNSLWVIFLLFVFSFVHLLFTSIFWIIKFTYIPEFSLMKNKFLGKKRERERHLSFILTPWKPKMRCTETPFINSSLRRQEEREITICSLGHKFVSGLSSCLIFWFLISLF